MSVGDLAEQARQRWVELMGTGGAQDRASGEVVAADLSPVTGLTAVAGRGQTTVDWDPVPGAIGYAVHRATVATGPYEVVDHGGGDVLAVPHPPYADTTGEPGREYWYSVAPLATVNAMGPLCPPVPGGSVAGEPGAALPAVRVTVAADGDTGPLHRPWRAMVGSEHLSHLLCADLSGGRPIGTELREALRRAHDELGVESVRAHAILGDDLGIYREVDGEPRYDFSRLDRVYDTVLELGMRPVVELGYMPRDLARDPSRTVFAYQAVISPPKNWDRWADLVRATVTHLVDRYGRTEVVHWFFEVWNEANLSVFWAGSPEEYWQLYRATAAAVKQVDPEIRVGGPASAAVGWIDAQLAVDAPVDFLSTHVYGSPPLDLRPLAAAHGRPDLPLLWTEWGVTATHGSDVNDTVFAATFLLRGMRSASRRIDALAPWVASDHFEELGRPPRLLHGGFGLLTVGNLAKPKFWALALAQRLGDTELPVTGVGDGARSLVEAWAARTADGTVGVLCWNGTLDHSRVDGAPELDRRVAVRVTGLPGQRYELRQWRVDAGHSNVAARWRELGGGADWPDEAQWRALAEADRLAEAEPRYVEPVGGELTVELELPMPGIHHLELRPLADDPGESG
ncbi:GH39 family glycosyl hydrolase [Plantactinospora soyae]|uniref:Xylan 1,4-beta-xylosidase n=1 Tax=Plantactinospora soyae TaxID=1544732 RepID=A0A927QVH9_9ACTN|nr:xylan 1,4-beta-xylosidase [Plantactinospora soyae]MBE1484397.1 xylan 1,4-beta-xylosidase [Plantactinospora soyae]